MKNIDLNNSKILWLRLEQEIPFELEDSFSWFLSTLKINRFSFEYHPDNLLTQTLCIWLPLNEWSVEDQDYLVRSITSLAKPFAITLQPCKWIQVNDEDWSSSWKKNWEPDPIGSSILILPSWLDIPKQFVGRKVIRIDPGSAFGTGSHPSTRLLLEYLDKDPPTGKIIADLGCGSGILSLTALKLGAKCTFAVDIDSLAISATKFNSALNDFPDSLLNVYLGSIEELEANIPHEKVDLMLCNILAPVIKTLGSGFNKIISDQGKVILSGLLIDQTKELEDFFYSLGWLVFDIHKMDQWASMGLIRNSSQLN